MGELIEKLAPDVFGTQEGLYGQLQDLTADLPAFQWIGVGRDGGSRGEFMAVFYRTTRLEPLAFDYFWLSDTPEVIGSKTWGPKLARMVIWVKFRDRQTKREFIFVNTHFDHQVQAAREKNAQLQPGDTLDVQFYKGSIVLRKHQPLTQEQCAILLERSRSQPKPAAEDDAAVEQVVRDVRARRR